MHLCNDPSGKQHRKKTASAFRQPCDRNRLPFFGNGAGAFKPASGDCGSRSLWSFAAWQLTLAGYAPLILERGKQVEDRSADVERFWKTGILQPDSNVQFGEGGAGTFSDGKLNTVVKDPSGRNRYVLETFVKFGAPSDILYDAKPHIGTDILAKVIKNMRDYLIKHGAEFRFQTCLKDIQIKENALHALVTEDDTVIPADVAILALGHSARDTFMMLHRHQLPMEAKILPWDSAWNIPSR